MTISAAAPQRKGIGMAPRGYGSYPRTEETQFSPDNFPQIVGEIFASRHIIPEADETFRLFSERFGTKTQEKLVSKTIEIESENVVYEADSKGYEKPKDGKGRKGEVGAFPEIPLHTSEGEILSEERFRELNAKFEDEGLAGSTGE